MPIIVSEHVAKRGEQDAKRHRKKQNESITKQLPYIISKESIITGKKGKIVKVPIKNMELPTFKHGGGKGGYGVGQGSGQPGDIIGKKPGQGQKGGGKEEGKAGTEPGGDFIYTEFTIEELVEMALEDCGLPNLKEKSVKQIIVEEGFKIRGTQTTGPAVLMKRRQTAHEGLKRYLGYLEVLKEETGCSEPLCKKALAEAEGIFDKAETLLRENKVVLEPGEDPEPFPILHQDDYRYHRIEEDKKEQSRAVIFACLDVSFSMSDEEKYYARMVMFWITQFLRTAYEKIDIRFIVHHTEAHLVREEEFFQIVEGGGTVCASAYELVNTLIDEEYPTSSWNVYVLHFSDGDDFSPEKSVVEMEKMFKKDINMFGYGQVEIRRSRPPVLLEYFQGAFDLTQYKNNSLEYLVNPSGNPPFLVTRLKEKDHIWPAVQVFLFKERWANSE